MAIDCMPPASADARVRVFQFGGIAIRVSAPQPCARLWLFLEAYFSPFFDLRDAGVGAELVFDVEIVIGTGDRELDWSRCEETDVDRSGGFLHCRGLWVDRNGERLVRLLPFDVGVRIDRDRRRAIVTGADEMKLRVPILRVIEDVAVAALEIRGAVLIHASAVVADGRAVLLAGNKGAGKTTSLCRLLALFDVGKLANDNVVLWQDGASIIARGWPSFFKAAAGTVATHEALAGAFPADLRQYLERGDGLWQVYEKVVLYPVESAELFHRCVEPQAVLSTIILPHFGIHNVPRLVRTDRSEVSGEIASYLQGSQNPNHPDWMGLGTLTRDALAIRLNDMLSVLSTLNVFRLEWAPSLDDLLADIPDLRPHRQSFQASTVATGRAPKWPPLPSS